MTERISSWHVNLCGGMALVFAVATASADTPSAPFVLDSAAGGCLPMTEICGDGVDQDCDGADRLCPGPDRDRDGYTINDCDDTNRHIYPGISVPCRAVGGAGTKTCQGSGEFTECSTTPLCEAVGSGRCYYISALTGSDSNPGTFQAPWKTYRNIVSYYGGAGQPAGWKQLQAGDVVYFMSGLYQDTYRYNAETQAMFFRFIHGTPSAPIRIKAYPGAHPVLTPSIPTGAIYILQSSHFVVEGFEVNRAYQWGVRFADGSNFELRNMWIHDTDGVDNNNLAGVYINNSTNISVHHSLIHDNYDRTNADTGGQKTTNSRNLVFFGGGNIRIRHNVIFQTPPIDAEKSGVCLDYKHSATEPGSIFEVGYNTLWNCAMVSIGSGTFGSRVHHNIILNSAPMRFADFGGPTSNVDNIVEYNTVIGNNAVEYNPTLTWGPIGLFTFRRNIVVDQGSYHLERGILTVHVYGSDAVYEATVTAGNLAIGPNCYYNPSASLRFNLFNANGGAYGSRGAVYDLHGWRALGYDTASVSANPLLDGYFIPQNPACQGFGAFAN